MASDEKAMAPMDTGLATQEMGTGGISVYAREQHELQAAFMIALHKPRNESAAFSRIMASCERAGFAEGASYSFPRGGARVTGPSVKLAREMARCWGNIKHGIRIVTMDEDWIHVKGWALDLETNTAVENEDKFKRLVQRKNKRTGATEWIRPDERDLRELVNRHGAICVRNALLQLLPADLVDEAERVAGQTMVKAAKGELTQSPEDTRRRLVVAFRSFGVTVEMIERRLAHPLEEISADELADLRQIYASLTEGNSKRNDHFETTAITSEVKTGTISAADLKAGEPPEKPQPKEPAFAYKTKAARNAAKAEAIAQIKILCEPGAPLEEEDPDLAYLVYAAVKSESELTDVSVRDALVNVKEDAASYIKGGQLAHWDRLNSEDE